MPHKRPRPELPHWQAESQLFFLNDQRVRRGSGGLGGGGGGHKWVTGIRAYCWLARKMGGMARELLGFPLKAAFSFDSIGTYGLSTAGNNMKLVILIFDLILALVFNFYKINTGLSILFL